jgi:hypothetical protein
MKNSARFEPIFPLNWMDTFRQVLAVESLIYNTRYCGFKPVAGPDEGFLGRATARQIRVSRLVCRSFVVLSQGALRTLNIDCCSRFDGEGSDLESGQQLVLPARA